MAKYILGLLSLVLFVATVLSKDQTGGTNFVSLRKEKRADEGNSYLPPSGPGYHPGPPHLEAPAFPAGPYPLQYPQFQTLGSPRSYPPPGPANSYLPPGPPEPYLPPTPYAGLPPPHPLPPPQAFVRPLQPHSSYLPPTSGIGYFPSLPQNAVNGDFDYNSLGVGSLLTQVLAANHIAGLARNYGNHVPIGATGYNHRQFEKGSADGGSKVQPTIVTPQAYGGPLDNRYPSRGSDHFLEGNLIHGRGLYSSPPRVVPLFTAGPSYDQAHQDSTHDGSSRQTTSPARSYPNGHHDQSRILIIKPNFNNIVNPSNAGSFAALINHLAPPKQEPQTSLASQQHAVDDNNGTPVYAFGQKGLGQYQSKTETQSPRHQTISKAPFRPSAFLGMNPDANDGGYLPSPNYSSPQGHEREAEPSYQPAPEVNFVTPVPPYQSYDLPPNDQQGSSYLPPTGSTYGAPSYNTLKYSSESSSYVQNY